MKKIEIESRCMPYMYNTDDDLCRIEIGDTITLQFGNKRYGVKKEYVGTKVKFIVNNFIEYTHRIKTRKLALIPVDKINNFKEKDVLILDAKDRFECLMIDLFPCNRRHFAGWENRTVAVKENKDDSVSLL